MSSFLSISNREGGDLPCKCQLLKASKTKATLRGLWLFLPGSSWLGVGTLCTKTAQSPPKNPGPRAARLNGFYTYICLRKLRV